MNIANDWKDYEILATGDGEKLERWGNIYLLRPDPQIIWKASKNLSKEPRLNAHYHRTKTGGGAWEKLKKMPEEWIIGYKNLRFQLKPMGFKHTGLFPEQAYNWDRMIELIKNAGRPINVLNLFAYTGGATVACASAGASVCHVDAAKNMVERAKTNASLSGLSNAPIRYIVDDCRKFIEREIRRGHKYDAIIMDPPSYGRGANGEVWNLEDNLYDFVELTTKVLSDKPLFVLINSYTTGLGATVLKNILGLNLKQFNGKIEAYELCLPTNEKGVLLPCGTSGIFIGEN
ncbi:MAG: class I SAM-dependent methyltransferase [Clostridia bacterium]|nr:class I SAM-dependent methyltransferase [Clostridia bacterium]